MTPIILLIMCVLYFVCVGLDITMFFLQVRLLLTWRDIKWLKPFDISGKPVIDFVTTHVFNHFVKNRQLSEKGMLVFALITTVVLRVLIGCIINPK